MASPPLTREQLVAIGRDIIEAGQRLSSSLLFTIGGDTGPASKEAIEALKNVDGCNDQWECVICLDLLVAEKNQARKKMPCGHRFHGVCLEKWLRVQGTCPTCRHQR